MNINEVSELLGINPETLRKWDKHFNLNVRRNKKGHRDYDLEDVKTLQVIKQLRSLDNGIETIQRKLNLNCIEEPGDEKSNSDNENVISDNNVVSVLEVIKKEFVSKLDSIIELSEKYSRACFEIGKLQAEKDNLENSTKLISVSFEREKEVLESENNKLKLEIESLKSQLEEKNKPWYKKILGYYYSE